MPLLTICARALPGADCCGHSDVQVGVQHGREPAELVPADAASACWVLELGLGPRGYRGPVVQGRPGARFVYLTWGSLTSGAFVMFRRLKVWLPEPARADDLVLELELTDGCGAPLCGSVHPWRRTDVRS